MFPSRLDTWLLFIGLGSILLTAFTFPALICFISGWVYGGDTFLSRYWKHMGCVLLFGTVILLLSRHFDLYRLNTATMVVSLVSGLWMSNKAKKIRRERAAAESE